MPWTRVGDSAAMYPALLRLFGVPGADDRTVNEVFGWVMRAAFQSAAHLTDYVIDMGTLWSLGGGRTPELIRLAQLAGLLTEVETKDGFIAQQLIQDPEFIHIRLAKEVEWERQRQNDTRNPALKVAILRRDGDRCRWCGVGVQWRGKKTNRSAQLDHLFPGKPGSFETMVVACAGCNGGRGQDVQAWDDNHTLLPPPDEPVFGAVTAKYLTEQGWPTAATVPADGDSPTVEPQRSSSQLENATCLASMRPNDQLGNAPESDEGLVLAADDGDDMGGVMPLRPNSQLGNAVTDNVIKRESNLTPVSGIAPLQNFAAVPDAETNASGNSPNNSIPRDCRISFAGSGREWSGNELDRAGPGLAGSGALRGNAHNKGAAKGKGSKRGRGGRR